MYNDKKMTDKKGKRTFFYKRKKVCKLCEEKIEYVDWKDVKLLMGFIPLRSKILPRRISGTCAHSFATDGFTADSSGVAAWSFRLFSDGPGSATQRTAVESRVAMAIAMNSG